MSQITSFLSSATPLPPDVPTKFTEDVGVAVPVANNLNVFGGTGISTVGAGDTITINADASVATQYTADVGVAVPVANNLNVFGGTAGRDINTSAAASTIHVDLNNAITLGDLVALGAGVPAITLTTGDATITAGNINFPFTNTGATQGAIYVAGVAFMHDKGTGNTFLGQGAGSTAVTNVSLFNTNLGSSAAASLTSSSDNVSLGSNSLLNLTSGNGNNVALGVNSLENLVTGAENIAIGSGAGLNYTGVESSNIVIGNLGVLAESNTIHIGTSGGGVGQQSNTYIAGINGVNVGSVASVVSISGDHLGFTTITAGAGITVTPGANTITISSIGAGVTWSIITVNQTAAVENGYFCNKAGTLALALPAASVIGDVIEVANENTALGIQFTQAAGQQILIGNTNTTLGATGTLTSSAVGDTLTIVCKVANTIWRVTSMVGNWTPA